MFVYCSGSRPVFCSDTIVEAPGLQSIGAPEGFDSGNMHDYRLKAGRLVLRSEIPIHEMVVAMVCNWDQNCGISTYSRMMVDAIIPRVQSVHIVSEKKLPQDSPSHDGPVSYCWRREGDYSPIVSEIEKIDPDLIIIQHEYGIFHHVDKFCALMSQLSRWRTVTILHTVLEHRVDHADASLDYEARFIAESACPEVMVHQRRAAEALKARGYSGRTHVIPHGCPSVSEERRLPITKYGMFTAETIFQYGFGGTHKGWEFSIDTVEILIRQFPNVFYFGVMNQPRGGEAAVKMYHDRLCQMIKDRGLDKNISLICGFQSEQAIRNYMRSFRVVMYPYRVPNKHWASWGASGAVQLALTYGRPIILTSFPAFMEFEGHVEFTNTPEEAAAKIAKIFTDAKYEEEQQERSKLLAHERAWYRVADWILQTSPEKDFNCL